ncbi:MAG TPA: hypothetical protein VIL74_07715 [Pyrinomonadaceae bacterium]|jgi:hypothetical protein
MARIEYFYRDRNVINLTASVGKNGVNLKGDVMVVQAMLKYALAENSYFRDCKFPEPTGAMNDETLRLIEKYQKFLRRKDKTDVAVDGLIDRAVGEKPNGRRGQWTILCLNSHVLVARLLGGGEGNEIQDLCRRYPQLKAVLGDLPVGSLGLMLEPSGVGSLGLALE